MDLGAVPHRLEEGKSASEDAGPQRGSLKEKAHRGQYRLAVGLDRYNITFHLILVTYKILFKRKIYLFYQN